MSNDAPTPPADDFPAGQTGDMRDVLLSPPTGPKTPAGPWQPPTAEELQKLLPQYEITALLGRGGMGAVYKGRQIALDRPVAIKILSNTLEEADASFAERFKNEARALGKLSHPGIVGVYDFGEAANGLLYIVMEFIDGTDVARMLAQQKRLHTEHAMAITAHVCDALAYAHERGIIHRDIKPANIMVGYDGVVKVADFGLAKMTHSQNSGLTQSGMAMGTLHYMAPEALMLGSAVDHRADIYAVGVMLYQMLTGKVPQGMFELPSLQVPGLDPRYDSIISRAMREDREVRYPRVLDMRHDLDAILTQPVVKVEAAAEKAPAALETLARPQRPAGQPYRPPQREVIVRTEKKGAPLLWVAVVALAALAAWLYLNRTVPESAPQPPSLVTGTPPGPAVNESSASTTSNPADATQDRPFVNSLGMKFVPVPGTKVLFCIHETRHKDYAVYATENSSVNARWRTARVPEIPDFKSSDNDPLFGVNWNESKAFCEWLSRKEGVKYRLPSDREWSHAVGIAGRESVDSLPADLGKANSIIYPWGQGWPPPKGAGNFSDESVGATTAFPTYIRGYNDKYPGPSPVMSFPPNKLGLHDLGGNVSEWCEDWYDSSKKERVLRDSTWYCDSPSVLFSSRRFNLPPDYAGGHIGRGFRCVIDLASQPVITKPITANTPPLSGPAFNAHKAGLTMPKGRQSHGSSQYEFVATACTWDEARQKAEEMGGHLATITSKEENDWIKQTYGNLLVQGCQHFWLGGRQDTPDAAWRWITAEPFYFKAWNPGRPGQGAKALHPRFMNFYHARTAGEPIGWSDLISGGEFDQDRVGFLVEWDGTQPPAAPALPTGPTTWTDTKGRSITATFKALASGNVLLEIVGKVTPVPLNTLSAESQKLARAYHDQSSAPAANDPAKATKDKPFTNSLGMKFVPVPGTKVLMCIHETRNQDYAAYAASNPAVDDKWKSAKQDAGLPAAFVNWHEATAFCEWLTQKDGIKHRLPTDREWSFAIGIGNQEDAQSSPEALSKLNQDIYPWGKNWPPPNNSGNYWDAKINELSAKASFQATYADGFNSRSPVMSFPANTLGLYDLEGNVLEWCEDWYNEQRERKVHRGPSFMTGMLGMKDFRSSHRRNDPPENREDRFAEFGFRCVIELPLASASASPPAVAPPAVPATSAPEPGPELRWVDSSGRVIMARFGGINGENVMLVRADGSRLPYPMTRLSSASQQLARDLAAGTSPAQQGIAGKSFDAITLDDIVKSQDLLKSDRIEASDDRVLAVGTILIYQTCEGRFGKARVEAPAPRKGDYTLTLSWCTFEQDNKVRSSGKNLVIKSLFAVDLDAGKLAKTNDGADIHWGLQSVDSPYLARSQKPALLAILPSSTSAKP